MYYVKKWKSQKNKFGAKKTEYKGDKYDSKLEAKYAWELDMRVKAGDIQGYDRQVKTPINVAYYSGKPTLTIVDGIKLKKEGVQFNHICNYYIDFLVYHNDGTTEFFEVKGFETQLWRMKWKLLEAALRNHETYTMNVYK